MEMAILLTLLAAHFALIMVNHSRPLVGDEPYYVEKGAHIVHHHSFAPARASELEIVAGRQWGNADWRPQGYPLFLALIAPDVIDDPPALRRRVTIVQFLLTAALVVAWFGLLAKSSSSRWVRMGGALLLTLPWPFEYVTDIGADTLNLVLAGAGLVLWILWASSPVRNRYLLTAAALLSSATLLVRPEMIAIAPIMALIGLVARRRYKRVTPTELALVIVVMSLPVLFQAGYRTWFVGRPGVFGPLRIVNSGAFEWTRTWIGTEKEAYDFVYAITGGLLQSLPDRAFENQTEREMVDRLQWRAFQHGYTRELDDAFAALASERRRAHPIVVAMIPLLDTVQIWINLETPGPMLNALAQTPRSFRHPILGGLFVARCLIVVFALDGARRSLKRWRAHQADMLDTIVLAAFAFAVARTALVALILQWRVHRYMVVAWIPLLCCAAASLRALDRDPIASPPRRESNL